MDYKAVSEEEIEILPEGQSIETVLKELARLSYEMAETVPPHFVQPFEVPPSLVDFGDLATENGVHLEYLNGRRCSTHVARRGGRYFLDARAFKEDRGSPEAFLKLLKKRLEGAS